MKIYRVKEVLIITSFGSRSSLWRAVKSGRFPAPHVISANRVGWFDTDVDQWAKSLPVRDYQKPTTVTKTRKYAEPLKIGEAGQ